MRRRLQRLHAACLCAALALLAAHAHADSGHHPLWTVKGAHNTLYLLGSVHVLKSGDRELPDGALEAYAHAATLVMEVDLNKARTAALGESSLKLGALPEGQTLAQVLGPDAYQTFVAHARPLGVDPELVSRLQPWFVAMLLLRLEYTHMGYDFESGVESQLAQLAAADGKPIIGLETVDEQLGLFAHLSLAEQRRFLLYTLEDADETPQIIDEMVGAWRRGDAAALNAVLSRGFDEFPELYAPLTSDRNRRWLPTLTRLLHERQDCLVVVGALHLVGRDGVLELLRKQGYMVTQH